ncbi:RNA-dependent RNA polymerase [Streptobotrys caulophylli fusagravirus 1]|nr:RNA-dependent RNA polymerase [Streptobotrys caulophylli fusagravirus 1]
MLTQLLRSDNEWEETTAVALLLLDQFSPLSHLVSLILLKSPDFFLMTSDDATSFLKLLHLGVRMTRTLPSGEHLSTHEARALYGIDTIFGRSEKLKFDPVGEISSRLLDPTIRAIPHPTKPLFSSSPYYQQHLAACAREAVLETLSPEYAGLTFSDWYSRRMFWAASGGAPGASVVWAADLPAERLNKRGALLIIPENHIRHIMADVLGAVLWSKAAPKYENSKIRAIWNTAVEHYVIQGFILDQYDSAQRADSWSSAYHSRTANLRADLLCLTAISGQEENSVGLMWDYSDFNINHTFDAMNSLFTQTVLALCERVTSPKTELPSYADDVRSDLHRALGYVTAARRITILEDPESGIAAQVARSLQSGERATSFVNTLLSRTYLLLHGKWCEEHLGYRLLSPISYHQGDDVYALTSSVYTAMLACIIFNLLGFAGQTFKVTADFANRGEYLRLHYDLNERLVAGYPLRSCMGILAGEFFRESVVDPAERIAAFLSQLDKVVRRGGGFPFALFQRLISNRVSLTYTDSGGVKHRIAPALDLLAAPQALGGYGFSPTHVESYTGKVSSSASRQDVYDLIPAIPVFGPRASTRPVVSLFGLPPMSDFPRFVAYLPSGEGKTTLCDDFPHLFTDHDAVVDQSGLRPELNRALEAARLSGDYSDVNSVLATAADVNGPAPGRVLLTWGPYCHFAARYRSLGSFLLSKPTGIRANSDNRTSLIAATGANYFPSHRARDDALLVALMTVQWDEAPAFARGNLLLPRFRQQSGPATPPTYIPPRVDSQAFFSKAVLRRTNQAPLLQDFSTFQRVAKQSRLEPVRRLAIEGAIAGAYPASKVGESIAMFAESLEKWFKRTAPTTPHVLRPVPESLVALTIANAKELFESILKDGHPPSLPPTLFGITDSFVTPAGFTVASIFKLALQSVQVVNPADPLGPYLALAENSSRLRIHPLFVRFTEYFRREAWARSPEVAAALLKYCEGSTSFYPPHNFAHSPSFYVAARHVVLNTIESFGLSSLLSEPLLLQDVTYRLEVVVVLTFYKVMFQHFSHPVFLTD